MNVTYLKQGELIVKSKIQKILSISYQVYAGAKDLILPACLRHHVQNVENLVLDVLKKKQ
jgi:hypothetical protein